MFRSCSLHVISYPMNVTIHQPDFLPWLGFFDKWASSDLYIILDDVQFLRRGWHHRDKIKTRDGVRWITVPVIKRGKYDQLIRDVEIDNSTDWRTKHLKTIEFNYKKAPNFEYFFRKINDIFSINDNMLIDLNMNLLNFVAKELGITAPAVFASDYYIKTTSTQRLVDLVKKVGGDVYLTGAGSKNYLDEALFSEAGIKVRWHQFDFPAYPQLHGKFEKNLSVLDFLMMASNSEMKIKKCY